MAAKRDKGHKKEAMTACTREIHNRQTLLRLSSFRGHSRLPMQFTHFEYFCYYGSRVLRRPNGIRRF